MNMTVSCSIALLVFFVNVFCPIEACDEGFFRHGLKGRRLKNHLLRTVTTLSVVDCSLECLRERCCQSINFGKDLNNMMEHDCELNEAKASTSPEDITRNDSYVHYEIMDTGNGDRSETCSKGLGSSEDFPGKNCNEIKQQTNTAISKEYWIKPNASAAPFLVYCEMETSEGGWTLVYRYTFTNYDNFSQPSNSVNPRPNWPAPEANVNISTVAPRKDTFGAIPFLLWQYIGREFFIRSNINDWYKCNPNAGSLVNKKDGSISCWRVKRIVDDCTDIIPTEIKWEDHGPVLHDVGISIYRFDGSTSIGFPVHDSCKGSIENHKKGVPNPYGQIFIK